LSATLPQPAARGAAPGDLSAELGAGFLRVLAPLLDRPGPIALVDLPAYDNVGDSALFLGELAALRELGALERLVYTCGLKDYVPATLSRRLGARGTLLISGGGNFGDVWEEHHRFREHLAEAYPRQRIVQLPQSIHFADPARLERTRAAFARHAELTLLVRDEPSRKLASAAFPRAVVLAAPDAAFCLGRLARPAPPEVETLWLLRADHESSLPDDAQTRALLPERTDWPRSDRGDPLLRRHRRLRTLALRLPLLYPGVARPLLEAARDLAAARVAGGTALLARGARVVTDRLHGHILCELLGIPHAMIDNSYGKLGRHHAAWTARSKYATMCASLAEAACWAGSRPPEASP
jgi:pyruvyl transferase EpsO